MAEEKWIRPAVAIETLIPSTDGVVDAHGITYTVKRARVPTMDYNPAVAVPGVVRKKQTKGPFQIGPMCVGLVHAEEGGFLDADWYFEMF